MGSQLCKLTTNPGLYSLVAPEFKKSHVWKYGQQHTVTSLGVPRCNKHSTINNKTQQHGTSPERARYTTAPVTPPRRSGSPVDLEKVLKGRIVRSPKTKIGGRRTTSSKDSSWARSLSSRSRTTSLSSDGMGTDEFPGNYVPSTAATTPINFTPYLQRPLPRSDYSIVLYKLRNLSLWPIISDSLPLVENSMMAAIWPDVEMIDIIDLENQPREVEMIDIIDLENQPPEVEMIDIIDLVNSMNGGCSKLFDSRLY